MVLDLSNGSNLEQPALKGLTGLYVSSFTELEITIVDLCYQGRSEEHSRSDLGGGTFRSELGSTPFTQSQRQDGSHTVAKSTAAKPVTTGKSSSDELQKQIRELNKTVALSEEAVRTSDCHVITAVTWSSYSHVIIVIVVVSSLF